MHLKMLYHLKVWIKFHLLYPHRRTSFLPKVSFRSEEHPSPDVSYNIKYNIYIVAGACKGRQGRGRACSLKVTSEERNFLPLTFLIVCRTYIVSGAYKGRRSGFSHRTIPKKGTPSSKAMIF